MIDATNSIAAKIEAAYQVSERRGKLNGEVTRNQTENANQGLPDPFANCLRFTTASEIARFRGGSRHLLPCEVVRFDGRDGGEELREREQLRHLAHRGLLRLDAQILHGRRPPRTPTPAACALPRESPPNPVGRRSEKGTVGMRHGEIV